jgi:hypothetical protein
MRKLKILEVSGVDKPAQEHALVAIIKRANGAQKADFDMSNIDTDVSDDPYEALKAKAEELRKVKPELSEQQAFAKVYTDPANAEIAKAERGASLARIAGVPVARTAAVVLNDLSDDEIEQLVDEIRRDNPYLDDADIVRLLTQRVESPTYRADVAAARRAGSTAPAANGDLTQSRDEAALEAGRESNTAIDRLNKLADELRERQPDLSKAQAFSAVYLDSANRELAKAERSENRPVAS